MINFTEQVEIEPDFLRVTTVGKYEYSELFGFIQRIKKKAEAAGKDRVLIDSSQIKGSIAEAERFQAGQRIAQIFGGRTRLAWVMPASEITKLGELAAVNRGAKFLVAESVEAAIEWLMSEDI